MDLPVFFAKVSPSLSGVVVGIVVTSIDGLQMTRLVL
jgi:hypothetical protein